MQLRVIKPEFKRLLCSSLIINGRETQAIIMTEKEFNHIILPLAKQIHSFAFHMVGGQSYAADVTQEVMFKLWDNRRELPGVNNLKAYVLKITRNICLDLLKRQQPVYHDEKVYQYGGYSDPVRQIEQKDALEAVRRIIDSLPANQKEVMLLREIEELEFDEIAKITGLGLNNIRVLLSRARTKVKQILTEQYQISDYNK